MRKVVSAVLALGLLAGCDDDDGGGGQAEVTTTTVAAEARATEIFVIPFSIDLPEDWTLTERDDRLVQLWPGDLEESAPYEISIGADYEMRSRPPASTWTRSPSWTPTIPTPM